MLHIINDSLSISRMMSSDIVSYIIDKTNTMHVNKKLLRSNSDLINNFEPALGSSVCE